MNKKKGAMELSIGTIVVIVLAMSMLILGLILVKNIFSGSSKVVDMTNEQLLGQIRDLFGNDRELTLYPASKRVTITQGEVDGFGIGIKNRGTAGTFSYNVIVSDPDFSNKCGASYGSDAVNSWIVTGRAENGIQLAPGQDTAMPVLIEIPEGTILCTFRLRVNLFKDGQQYASEPMDVTVEA